MSLLDLAKAELLRSNADKRHPFRYFTLGTLSEYPELRTVVKRKTENELETILFTDSRTPKVEQIRQNNKVSLHFYHPKKKLQIRINGQAELIEEGHTDYDEFYNQIKSAPSLKDYTTQKRPGTEVKEESQILFGDDIHFIAIRVHPEYLDILQLGSDHHQRSAYFKNGREWEEKVLVP
ncbi:MAG: pyridoxamine 5'-phosphate oxidase family protein [Saprospiraceae bacterium]|nr:pyridoxamine 5'-phosphate oxidase family protein [Saprospiraceae bacterium]